MAKNDDFFDDFWEDNAPKQEPQPKPNASNPDWDFFGDQTPPKKKTPKKSNGFLWIVLAALLIIGIITQWPKQEPQSTQPTIQQPIPTQSAFSTLPQPTQPGQTSPDPQPEQPTQPAQPTQPTVPVTKAGPYRYLYQQLSAKEQGLFNQVLAGLETVESAIGPLQFTDEASLKRVMQAIWYDCPEVFWYDGSYSYTYYEKRGYWDVTLKPNYHWNKQQSLQNKAFVDQTLQPLVQQLSGLSDYEKVFGVHEYLVDRTAYTPSYRGTTLYEALRDKKAVCEGYARVVQHLMNQLEVPVIYVSGVAVNSAGVRDTHSWNLVQVDGQWYLLDVTWDDPYYSDGQQEKLYTYFCVTTEEMNRNHVPDLNIFPNCTATAANYHIRQGRYLSSYDTDTLVSWLAESSQSKELSFKCANKSIYNQVLQLLKSSQLGDLAKQAQISIRSYFYGHDDIFYIITITW